MKFSNRNGQTVNVDFSVNGEFKETILAQSGGVPCFISTLTDDLKNLPNECNKAILSNADAEFLQIIS